MSLFRYKPGPAPKAACLVCGQACDDPNVRTFRYSDGTSDAAAHALCVRYDKPPGKLPSQQPGDLER